jgi:hypothetical protein
MQPAPKRPRSSVVNWSIPGQLVDQFPMAAVVVNCPPLGGIDRLPSAPRISGSVPMQVETTALARSRCHIITRYVTATAPRRHRAPVPP